VSPGDRAHARFSFVYVGLLLALVASCKNPQEDELAHPSPIRPLPSLTPAPPQPALEEVSTFTPRGVEVRAPRYMVARKDLWLIALEEIDRVVYPPLPRWIVIVTHPTEGAERAVKETRTIYVRWRKDGHKPAWIVLPGLARTVDQATFN